MLNGATGPSTQETTVKSSHILSDSSGIIVEHKSWRKGMINGSFAHPVTEQKLRGLTVTYVCNQADFGR